jgi:hypothetical protein
MKRIPIWTCLILLTLSFSAPVQAGRLPDTGQTASYTDTFGEDSDYLINEPSYTKLSAAGDALPYTAAEWAMVQDNVTKLTWEVKTDDLSIHDRDNKAAWDLVAGLFISLLNTTGFGGHSDWRLPSIRELTSIVARNVSTAFVPAINGAFFPQTQNYYYWTSTTWVGDEDDAWAVFFSTGSFGYRPKAPSPSFDYYFRAVRGTWEGQQLVDNGDGTVTDMAAGLMWQQETPETPGLVSWEDALINCENLDLAGHSDWRLPNINELQSLADYGRDNPALSPLIGFPPTPPEGGQPEWRYWSSTTRTKSADSAWLVNFKHGYSDSQPKIDDPEENNDTFHVRAVRGGQNKQVGHLFVLTPNQASRWVIGRPVSITWETPPEITGNVKIMVSHDGGKTFDTTVADTTENDGSFEWQATGPDSVNCVLRIGPLDEPFQNLGTTQGLFTVRTNEAPTQPSSPTPADQASEQSLDVDLSWAPSTDPDEGDTVTYTVYFGTSAIPQSQAPVAEGHTTTTFDPGMLSCNGMYSWQIVAVDNHAATNPGPVWRFSTITVPGDVSGDCEVDLTDAILNFQVLSGLTPAQPVFAGGAVNGDGNNGPEEGAYILQVIAGLRPL